MPFSGGGVSGRKGGWDAFTLPSVMQLTHCVTFAALSLAVFLHSCVCFVKHMAPFTSHFCATFFSYFVRCSHPCFFRKHTREPIFLNDLMIRQSPLCSVNNRIKLQPVDFSKFSRCYSLPVKDVGYSATPVPLLFFSTGPVAIFFGVVAIVIFSFKGVTLGSWSHIFDELFEVIYPFTANSNSTPAIVFILLPVWAVATAAHTLPNTIKRVRFHYRHPSDEMPFTVTGKPSQVGIG